MSFRTTAILAILFAAIGSYVYFVELPRDPDTEGKSQALELDASSVTGIELEHPGRKVVLRRDGEDWKMVEPVEAPADQRNVENLIEAVEECEIKRTLEDSNDLAPYGLDHPSGTVRLLSADTELGSIKVGKKTPIGGSAYILRNDDPSVHLTNAAFVDRIDKTASDLRDKNVMDFDKADVTTLEVRAGEDQVVLERKDDSWAITAPASYAADGSQVGNLLSTLESLRATEFVAEDPDNLERYGLATPRSTLVLGFANGNPLELRLGNEIEGKLRVQTNRRSTVYAVAAWAAGSLDKNLDDFRDKTVAAFAPEDAQEIEIESATDRIGLAKRESGWESATHDGEIDQAKVDELLRELSTLKGFEIAADDIDRFAEIGLAPPARSLRVHDADGNLLAAVRIGSHEVGPETEYTAAPEGTSTAMYIRELPYQRINRGKSLFVEPEANSEGAAAPVPDGDTGDGVDDDALDDTAAPGEEG